MTYSFLKDYCGRKEAMECVITGEDKHGICRIFHEYLKALEGFILRDWKYASGLSAEDKKGAFECVYKHFMLVLHPHIFPEVPSPGDERLGIQAEKVRAQTLEQLEVKPEDRHLEVWNYCIKR